MEDNDLKRQDIFVCPPESDHIPPVDQIKNTEDVSVTASTESDKKQLAESVDFSQMNDIFESFRNALGIPAAITDLEGKVLSGSRWQKLCAEYHRKNPYTCSCCIENDTLIASHIASQMTQGRENAFYCCKNGLMTGTSPVLLNGRHIANIFIGQFFADPPDMKFFNELAETCGFDKDDYFQAVSEIPIMAKDKASFLLKMLTSNARLIGNMSVAQRHILNVRKEEETAKKKLLSYQEQLENLVRERTAELKEKQEALKDSEALFRSQFELGNIGITITSPEKGWLKGNPRLCEMLGYNEVELRQKTWSEMTHPDDLAPDIVQFNRVLSGEIDRYEMDKRFFRKDGTLIYTHLTVSCYRNPDKTVRFVVGSLQDITELKRSEAELRQAKETAETANKKITDSINYATTIQRSLLANLDVVKSYLPNSFFIWEPRDVVGGDIFYTESFENGFIVAVIDCTGHGVPGAFMTMIAVSALRRIVKDEGCHDPAEILKRLNHIVKTTLQQDKDYALSDDGMDVGIVKVTHTEIGSPAFGFQSSVLTFAGAKIPLYYISDHELIMIKGDRQSIGYKRSDVNSDYTNHTVHVEKHMCFYMATDGFTDQMGGKDRRKFGSARFRNLLQDISKKPFENQRHMLVQAFEEHRGGSERQDDVTVVGFGF